MATTERRVGVGLSPATAEKLDRYRLERARTLGGKIPARTDAIDELVSAALLAFEYLARAEGRGTGAT